MFNDLRATFVTLGPGVGGRKQHFVPPKPLHATTQNYLLLIFIRVYSLRGWGLVLFPLGPQGQPLSPTTRCGNSQMAIQNRADLVLLHFQMFVCLSSISSLWIGMIGIQWYTSALAACSCGHVLNPTVLGASMLVISHFLRSMKHSDILEPD